MDKRPSDRFDEENNADATAGMGRGMLIIFWVGALAFTTYLVSVWMDKQKHPTSLRENGRVTVVLNEGINHHYFSYGKINGQKVLFFVDTGASDVVIPLQLANKLGLRKGVTSKARTANGIVEVFKTKLDTLQIGDIKLSSINASINPGMNGDEILLGMSALKFLDFERAGDTLILRQ